MRELVFPARKKYFNFLQNESLTRPLEIYAKHVISDSSFEYLGQEKLEGSTLHHYLTSVSDESLSVLFSTIKVHKTVEEYIRGFKTRNSHALPKIMAIVNATPDSFYPGSRVDRNEELLTGIIESNPDIIDVGGESTRPGSREISVSEEITRLRPIVDFLKKNTDIPISLDTRHYMVLEEFGSSISYINDITGFSDPAMVQGAVKYGLKCVSMHMRGEPKNMQSNTEYTDVVPEVLSFLLDSAEKLENAGIAAENIFLDPGVGFAKDLTGNLELIRDASSFNVGYGTLYGTSRKSFLGKITGNEVGERLSATLATTAYLTMEGVGIIRVHDVKENSDVIKIIKGIIKSENQSFR